MRGGTIDKHIGDAAMALSSTPRRPMVDDGAARGTRNSGAHPDETQVSSGPLSVHVALAMGDVVESRVCSERRRE